MSVNLLRYLPVFISFILTVVLIPRMIPVLRKLKFGQFVRDDGPESHLKKSGTPTMGGLIYITIMLIVSVAFTWKSKDALIICGVTFLFGVIGFIDDYLKVVKKMSKGLNAKQKFLMQIVVTALYLGHLLANGMGTEIYVPFSGGLEKGLYFNPGIVGFVCIIMFIMLGTVNGANFTDGLDGLAGSVTLIITVFLTIVVSKEAPQLMPVTLAMAGALAGYLMYNSYPAAIFMGDTGSLALGGFVCSMCVYLKIPILLVFIAFIYLCEILSSIIQVSYFKITHGKRIFKMAPIHHHFEKCGYSETKIVAAFDIITAIGCVIALMAL